MDIFQADLTVPEHGEALLYLLNSYALDPMGGNQPLAPEVHTHLIAALKKRSNVHVVLAMDGKKPAGLAICMEGFSTFACQPLLNLHDFTVHPDYRGQGLSKRLLAKVEEIARALGCCKMTLEVLTGNTPAYSLYKAVGFVNYELNPELGHALMMQKKLTA